MKHCQSIRLSILMLMALSLSWGASAPTTVTPTAPTMPAEPEPVITGIQLSPAASQLEMDSSVTLSATVEGDVDAPQEVSWESSDSFVASVDSEGVVTGVAPGSAVITATSLADSAFMATAEVTVVCRAPETVSGHITADVTWTAQGAGCIDYRVTGTHNVSAVLSIEAGTIIAFEQGAGLSIANNGEIIATGSAEQPILFTGTQETPGWWNGLYVWRSDSMNNRMDHVVIEYGGRDGGYNLQVGASGSSNVGRVALTNSTLRHSDGYGLYVSFDSNLIGSSSNHYYDNASGPAHVSARTAHYLDAASSFRGNGHDAVRVSGDSSADSINSNVTWQALEVGYEVSGNVRVDATWTLEAGARLAFLEAGGITVAADGEIIATGTQEAPVVFTATQAVPGWWSGIYFWRSNSINNAMDHVVIEYGGRDGGYNLQVGASGRSNVGRVALTNSILRHSEGYGLHVSFDSNMSGSSSNRYYDNTSGPAQVSARVAHFLDENSSFVGNGHDAVRVEAGSSSDSIDQTVTWQALDATYEIDGNLRVDAPWTIDPGAHLSFLQGAGITLGADAEIHAVGTEEQPIVFTGSQETPGWWNGIYLWRSNSMNNVMAHVTVAYGGGGTDDNAANLRLGSSGRTNVGRLTLTDSRLEHSAAAGLWASSDSTVNGDICTVNSFSGNESDCVLN